MIANIVVILILIGSIIVCYVIARRRGANAGLWAVMGALFGPLAIPFAFFAKHRRHSARPPGASSA